MPWSVRVESGGSSMVSIAMGTPKMDGLFRENPSINGWWTGVAPFMETPKWWSFGWGDAEVANWVGFGLGVGLWVNWSLQIACCSSQNRFNSWAIASTLYKAMPCAIWQDADRWPGDLKVSLRRKWLVASGVGWLDGFSIICSYLLRISISHKIVQMFVFPQGISRIVTTIPEMLGRTGGMRIFPRWQFFLRLGIASTSLLVNMASCGDFPASHVWWHCW